MSMGLCFRPSWRVNRWVMGVDVATTKLRKQIQPGIHESSPRENSAGMLVPFVRERLQQPRLQRLKNCKVLETKTTLLRWPERSAGVEIGFRRSRCIAPVVRMLEPAAMVVWLLY